MANNISQHMDKLRKATGFSGVDISAVVYLPASPDNPDAPGTVFQLGSIQTLSKSKYTHKEGVKSLGFRAPMGFTRGSRTIAGTMIFNQLYNHVLDDQGQQSIVYNDSTGLLTYSSGSVRYERVDPLTIGIPEIDNMRVDEPVVRRRHHYDFTWDQRTMGRRLHASELPPFDIILIYVNELGNIGKEVLYGVELVTESGTLSIDDIYTEVVYQYVAMDMEEFRPIEIDLAERWQSQVLNLLDKDIGSAEINRDMQEAKRRALLANSAADPKAAVLNSNSRIGMDPWKPKLSGES